MAYLLRKTLYNVELIEYFERSDCSGSRQGLAALAIDSEGRDYTVENGKRAYAKVLEYGACNPWTYFVTFTFSPRNFNRSDSDACAKSLLNYLENFRNRHDSSFRYVLVPEPHPSSGMIHFHGLLYTFDIDSFSSEKGLDLRYMKTDKRSGRNCYVYKSKKILEKFGRNSFTKIDQDSIACTYYITKYIQKSEDQLLSHRYYCSQGLNGYTKVKSVEDIDVADRLRCFLFNSDVKPSFINDFMKKWVFPGNVTFVDVLSGKPLSESDKAFYDKKRAELAKKHNRLFISYEDNISLALYDCLTLEEKFKVAPTKPVPDGLFPEQVYQYSMFEEE